MGALLAVGDRLGQEPAPRRENIDELLLRHRAAQLADAAEKGDRVRTIELLNAHTDPNRADERARLPLHGAAFAGAADVVRPLLDARADANLADVVHGNRPLQIAAWEGHVEVARLLIHGRASVDAADKRGWTPLYSAAGRGHLATVQLLLSSRADPALAAEVGGPGVTPLQAATTGRHLPVAQAIRDARASAVAPATPVRRRSKRALTKLTTELHRCLQTLGCRCA
mmetsp:Transcript_30928/g.62396  ORF Transcript_30928/g.62396 Transcript_30928/m.62396 type:complete len:227 (+) Transcript_30928:122-802(+)